MQALSHELLDWSGIRENLGHTTQKERMKYIECLDMGQKTFEDKPRMSPSFGACSNR